MRQKLMQAQRFLFAHDQINNLFRSRRYRMNAADYRQTRTNAFEIWSDIAAKMVARNSAKFLLPNQIN